MAFFKVSLLLALAVVAVIADNRPNSYRPPQPSQRYERPASSEETYRPPQPAPRYERPSSDEESFEDAKYDFQWQVDEDDNNFGQQEQRDGDDTRGSYSVDLPDGRRQTVTYYVDGDSGYVAEVKYSGEARYSEESSEEVRAPRPSYQAPRSPYDD